MTLPSAPPISRALTALDTEPVEGRSLPSSPISPAQIRQAGWRLDDLWLPAVVCDATALEHNVVRFAQWCSAQGVDHAPHGKTTMAPRLWQTQLQHGAWAITAATAAQARTMRRHGVPRVLIANEVLDLAQLRWVAETADDSDFELFCLVDSVQGLDAMTAAWESATVSSSVPVLIELGVTGRRTGVRELGAARDLAAEINSRRGVRLVGVEGYEGVLPTLRDDQSIGRARQWLDRLTAFTADCDAAGLFAEATEIILTAGGSAYVDLVIDSFAQLPQLSRPVRPVVRSGCYISHDHLSYERSSPLRSAASSDPLRPALTCLARVLSCPEPGRALLGVGKRDVAFDIDLPIPLRVRRDGTARSLEGRALVSELNDHHGFCDHEPGALSVGDVVELGLSHPCTIFDKWSLIPLIDDQERVFDAIRTVF